MLHWITSLLYPPKCVLCRRLLTKDETDLCHTCRAEAPVFKKTNKSFSFIAGWTAVWYYMDNVRKSILRYKFSNARNYAGFYGKMIALRLLEEEIEFDVLTWVPTGFIRKLRRGYDQAALLAEAVGKELSIPAIRTLHKIRQVAPQSRLKEAAHRKANILGAYKPVGQNVCGGKRILLIDDIVTTGSTANECARILKMAGATEIYLAAIAAAPQLKK